MRKVCRKIHDKIEKYLKIKGYEIRRKMAAMVIKDIRHKKHECRVVKRMTRRVHPIVVDEGMSLPLPPSRSCFMRRNCSPRRVRIIGQNLKVEQIKIKNRYV